MGKLILKISVMLAIVIGASNYFIYIKTGKTPFSALPNFSFGNLSTGKNELKKILPSKTDQAFKWTDANGTVHYSSEAPADAHGAQRIELDPDTNLIQGIQTKALAKQEETAAEAAPQQAPAAPTMIYKPETIRKLIDDAKNVQDTLNKRTAELEKIQ